MTLLQGEDQLVGRTRWNTIRVQTTHNPPAFCSASSSSQGRCWTKALTPLPSIRQAVPNQTEGKTSWARALAYKEVCGGEKGGSLFRQALRPFLNGWSEATKIPEPHQRGHRIHCQSFVSNTCKPAGVCVCVEVVDQNFLPFQGYCVFLNYFYFKYLLSGHRLITPKNTFTGQMTNTITIFTITVKTFHYYTQVC